MGSVQVKLKGASEIAVKARLEEVAREAQLEVQQARATTSFVGATCTDVSLNATLTGLTLDEAEIRAKLERFEDEDIDPEVGVRFVVLGPR